MSKLMTRLEKLKEFERKDAEIKARAQALEIDARKLGDDFMTYMTTELGMSKDKQLHLAGILATVMESTIEPSRIITP